MVSDPAGKNSFPLLSEVDLISVEQNVICKQGPMVIQLKSLSPTQVLPTSIVLSVSALSLPGSRKHHSDPHAHDSCYLSATTLLLLHIVTFCHPK